MVVGYLAKKEGAYASLPVDEIDALSSVCATIEKYNFLDKVNKMFNTGLLSPLTLKDDEFKNEKDENGYFTNLRYPYIVKTGLNKILNLAGYNIYVRAKYNHDDKKQEEFTARQFEAQPKLYISKGGVVTGEYIENCILKEEVIDQHSYNIRTVPSIPVCIVKRKDDTYYVVDHREPKIKSLKEMYEVPVYIDERVASMHMNLRNYKKLNK